MNVKVRKCECGYRQTVEEGQSLDAWEKGTF